MDRTKTILPDPAERASASSETFHETNITFTQVGAETMLDASQFVPRPVSEVFAFFAAESNLERLTPAFLRFRVLGKSTPAIREGTLIDYSLRVHGIPIQWKTLISEWKPNEVFIDEQLKGPYARWHHTHRFSALDQGTLMQDRVIFKLPLGALGRLVAGARVRADVRKIFEFRAETIASLFPKR